MNLDSKGCRCMSVLRRTRLCLLLSLLVAPLANGEKQILYRWSEGDQQHFSDHPPPLGTPYEKVVRKTTPAQQKPEAAAEKPGADQGDAAKPPAADASEQKIRQENCNNARSELRQLENSARVREVDPQGGSRMLSEEEKNARIERARQMIRDHCVAE